MGRPQQAMISKQAVLSVALEIINKEGLDALNVRRIADVIGVNAASLYHHFKSKSEIVMGAAELALEQTPFRIPVTKNSDWQDLLFAGALQERDFLLAYPELLSIIVRRRSEGFASQYLEDLTQRLTDLGVPIEVLAPIYDALESYTIGHVTKITAERNNDKKDLDKTGFPLLEESMNKRYLHDDEVFNISVLAIISAIKMQFTVQKTL